MSELVFHVSPGGDDGSDGRSPELGVGKSGPFATLERARDAVRRARQFDPAALCEVRLRGGAYFLPRTFELGPEDSGVVYAAFPGERPVISGGRRITGWIAGTHNGKECWTAAAPAGSDFKQLFVNGQRRSRPRLPKQGCFRFADAPKEVAGAPRFGHGPDRAKFKPGDISADWHDLGAVDLVSLEAWFSTHHRIKRVDPATAELQFHGRSVGSLREGPEFARYWVENVREALSEPGEWYLDRQTGRVTYLPLPDECLETAEIVAPLLEVILRLAGRDGRPVERVRFENLAFQHAEWRPPESFAGSVQAACDVPGALLFDHAERCALHGCQVAHVSQYGVEIGRGCHANEIVGCEITDMGAGGVRVDHEWLAGPVPIPAEAGAKPSATLVANCSIHDGTVIYFGAIGVFVGNAGHNRILDNHVYNLNYSGISCGWTWGDAPTATAGNRVEGNHVHHACWHGPLSDLGGIYILGRHAGGVVARNRIHHVGGVGIYLDMGASQLTVEDNVTYFTETGLFIQNGPCNVVRNNIFALFSECGFSLGWPEPARSCRFERNIVHATSGQPCGGLRDARHFLVRDCLLWRELPPRLDTGSTLGKWLEQGQLLGCLAADPLFFDPEGGDFTLRPDSPAFKLGFKPFTLQPRPDSAALLSSDLEWLDGATLRLTLRNHGLAPASGGLRLSVGPEGAARLKGPDDFHFEALPPGRELSALFQVDVDPDAGSCFAETFPGCDGLQPTFVSKVMETRLQVGRAESPASPEGVAAALASVPWRALFRPADGEVARWKLAVATDALLFQIQVADRRQVAADVPWLSSSVEFFVAPRESANRHGLTQFFLVPGSGWRGLAALCYELVPEPRVQGLCAPLADGGYELCAVVPFAVAKLEPDMAEFLFEAQINATFAVGQGLAHQYLFGARSGCDKTVGYGRLLVDKPCGKGR